MLDRSHFLANRPLMVLFDDGHCTPCRKLNELLLNNAGIAKKLQRFEAVQLDMWSDTQTEMKTHWISCAGIPSPTVLP